MQIFENENRASKKKQFSKEYAQREHIETQRWIEREHPK